MSQDRALASYTEETTAILITVLIVTAVLSSKGQSHKKVKGLAQGHLDMFGPAKYLILFFLPSHNT